MQTPTIVMDFSKNTVAIAGRDPNADRAIAAAGASAQQRPPAQNQ